MAEVGDRVTAYLSALMRRRDGVLTLETSETGGDPEATIDLAATLAADQGIDSFDLAVPGAHEALSNACERRGLARVDKPESGPFKLLDPERFVDRFRPLFAERADSESASNLEVVNKGGGCSFQLNDERLDVTTEADLLRLVFEPGWEASELPAGPLGTFLATAFSLPMIMPGFNYA